MRLVGSSSVSATRGTTQELEFIIAIDSDGSRIQQSSVLNMVTFTFNNSINGTMLQLTESNEFQHYVYASPPIDNTTEGTYSLNFSKQSSLCSYILFA